MKYCLLAVLLGAISVVFGQQKEDSVQLIETVSVSAPIRISPGALLPSRLTTSEIHAMQANDVGDVLRKFNGTNLHAYGGLGGLKTVSFRSLGAQHSAVVQDGFSVLNSQNGQINLGQIQTANLVGVQDVQAMENPVLLPVSSMVSGGTFSLQSFESVFADTGLAIRSTVSYASFAQLDGFMAVRFRKKAWQMATSGAMRSAEGNYPYRLENGIQTIRAERTNNAYQDVNLAATIGRQGKKSTFRLGYRGKEIKQELPGAVILYNINRDEKLHTQEHVIFSDFESSLSKKISLRVHAQASEQNMRYTDPDFLNAIGGINTIYQNRVLNGGVMLLWRRKNWTFQAGSEEFLSSLVVNDTSFAQPVRLHNMSVLSGRWQKGRWQIYLQSSAQYVSERMNGNAPNDRFRVNPMLRTSFSSKSGRFEQFFWCRSTFRMPTFNELYYNGIGNKNLLPEDAQLFNYGVHWRKPLWFKPLRFQSNIFFNLVQNKIVAIPTQNLFVWSMLNVGETLIFGGDVVLGIDQRLNRNWSFSLDVNYTYQRALDYTDSNSPTYLLQLAYVPVHTGNVDFELRRRNSGLLWSNYLVSMRYALNENIPENEVNGFWISDVSLYHVFNIQKHHRLTFRGTVKNMFNQSYAFIRSFVMPGRSFQFTLNYAFR